MCSLVEVQHTLKGAAPFSRIRDPRGKVRPWHDDLPGTGEAALAKRNALSLAIGDGGSYDPLGSYDSYGSHRTDECPYRACLGLCSAAGLRGGRLPLPDGKAADLRDALREGRLTEDDLRLALQDLNRLLRPENSEPGRILAADAPEAVAGSGTLAFTGLHAPVNVEPARPRASLHSAREAEVRNDVRRSAPVDPERLARPRQRRLRAQLFGHFTVYQGERTLPLPQDKNALAIFKYLLAHSSRPVSQESLRGWLWPESSPQKARWSLNSAVYSLRRFLNDELDLNPGPREPDSCSARAGPGAGRSPSSCVLLEAGHYRLSPGLEISLDTEDFDAYYEQGRDHERAGDMPQAVSAYERALALYEGDYLAESLYEGLVDWTTIERERLYEAYMDMLNRLAEHHLNTGQYRESIATCYRLLDKDCCYEDGYRLLIRCYSRLGLRVRALQHYRLCEQMLASQYGMDASPETGNLYKSLLRGESI